MGVGGGASGDCKGQGGWVLSVCGGGRVLMEGYSSTCSAHFVNHPILPCLAPPPVTHTSHSSMPASALPPLYLWPVTPPPVTHHPQPSQYHTYAEPPLSILRPATQAPHAIPATPSLPGRAGPGREAKGTARTLLLRQCRAAYTRALSIRTLLLGEGRPLCQEVKAALEALS